MHTITTEQSLLQCVATLPPQSSIVVVGGCFDVLHVGHIAYMEKAKALGDFVFVLLESDARIKKIKGHNRPFNNQHNRALVLTALRSVDYVVELPETMDNSAYDRLISLIKPAIIAITAGDPNRPHKDRQALQVGAKVVSVIERQSEHSTSTLMTKLEE